MNGSLAIVSIGLFTALIGGLGLVGVIPLGSLQGNNVSFTNLSASCTPNDCLAVVTVTNTNATSNFNVIFRLTTAAGVNLLYHSQPLTSAPQTVTLTDHFGLQGSGIYTVAVFAVSVGGIGISPTVTTTFNTGSITITMLSAGVAGTTTPPAGSQTYPWQTFVNIQFNPAAGYTFSNWLIICDVPLAGGASVSSNPYSLTTSNGNCSVSANTNNGGGSCSCFIVTPSGVSTTPPQGSISPSTPQSVTASNPVTFTATPNTGFYVVGWQVQEYPSLTSSAASITLTYAQLQAASNLATGNAHVVVTWALLPVLTVCSTTAGITSTVSPAALSTGSTPGGCAVYTYNPNTSVTITTTVASSACWLGYSLDGTNTANPSSLTLTVTMSQPHGVIAKGAPTNSGFCKGGGGGGGGSFPLLSTALLIGGLAITGIGAARARKEN